MSQSSDDVYTIRHSAQQRHRYAFFLGDARRVVREPFFLFMLFAPFLLGYGLRVGLPFIGDHFSGDIMLSDYYPIIIALIVLTPPLYYGLILALMVLEEREEGILLAIKVTPFTLKKYLLMRTTLYTLISLPMIMAVHELIGLVEISLVKLFAVAVAASLNTALMLFLLISFMKDRLGGVVMGKSLGALVLLPLLAFFIPGYWHLGIGILPTYWPIIAYYSAVGHGPEWFFWLSAAIAVVYQVVAVRWLYYRFYTSLNS